MTSKLDVSIIIINYNSKEYLAACIESIFKYTSKILFDIYVIDNNSNDDLTDLALIAHPAIKFLKNNENAGFSVANNMGIGMTSSKYVFLLNPDTKLLNNALNIFYDFMENPKNQNIWGVGGQLFDKNGKPSKSYGRFPNLGDVILEQFGIKGLLYKYLSLRKRILWKKIYHNIEVPFIMGCDMFIRKETLEKIGLFNKNFFLNFEETELAWRANKAGYKSMILPEANILHYSGKSFSSLKSYLSSLWISQVLFFKLTKGRFYFSFVKSIHIVGSGLRLIFKLDMFYLTHLKKITSM